MHPDISAYHASLAPRDRAIADRLAEEITRGLPEADGRVWHAHPVWFLEGNPIVGYRALQGCVRLLFWSGQSFAARGLSPQGKFEAAERRYTAPDAVDPDALQAWLAEAREVQWDYKNIVRRRGRLERLR